MSVWMTRLGLAIAFRHQLVAASLKHEYPQDWAMTENNLVTAWSALPTGDRAANLEKATTSCEAALRLRTEADFPQGYHVVVMSIICYRLATITTC